MGRRRRRRRDARRRRRRLAVALGAAASVALIVAILLSGFSGGGPATGSPEWSGERVRVEVLNAGGVTGMARRATGVLRGTGFDVVDFGNAHAPGGGFDETRPSAVIDRVGRTELAGAVAASLGIDNVLSDPDPNLYVDVSVVLGRDWLYLEDLAEPGDTVASRPFWDLRRWFGS